MVSLWKRLKKLSKISLGMLVLALSENMANNSRQKWSLLRSYLDVLNRFNTNKFSPCGKFSNSVLGVQTLSETRFVSSDQIFLWFIVWLQRRRFDSSFVSRWRPHFVHELFFNQLSWMTCRDECRLHRVSYGAWWKFFELFVEMDFTCIFRRINITFQFSYLFRELF